MPVTESDPIFPLLVEHRNAVASEYEKRDLNAKIREFTSIDTPSCKELFPELRFVSYNWSITPKIPDQKWSYTILEKTLAVDEAKGRIVVVIPPDDTFVKLLTDHAVKIRDEADAKLVWNSYCETHNRPWWDYGIERVGDSEWRIGVHKSEGTIATNASFGTIESGLHFHSVLISPKTYLIESWKYVSQVSGRRQVPIEEKDSIK